MLLISLYCTIAYLIGSISSAIIVCRLAGLPDPRTVGSQNPGATNVLRMGGKKVAVFTLLGDMLKGVIPVLVVRKINPTLPAEILGPVMVSVVLGHLYPIFFDFKGGKGVATALGATCGLSGILGSLILFTWIIVVAIFRMSSLGAVVAAVLAPFYAFFIVGHVFAIPMLVISVLLIFRHQANIKRILSRTEPKIGA